MTSGGINFSDFPENQLNQNVFDTEVKLKSTHSIFIFEVSIGPLHSPS